MTLLATVLHRLANTAVVEEVEVVVVFGGEDFQLVVVVLIGEALGFLFSTTTIDDD